MDGMQAIPVPLWKEDVGILDRFKMCNQLCSSFALEAIYNRLVHTT